MSLFDSKHFIRALWLLMILLIVFIGEKVSFVFYPFIVFFQIVFLPLSFAVVFYYIIVPLINWLEKKKVKRVWGTVGFFLSVILILIVSMLLLGSSFADQIVKLTDYLPFLTDYLQESFEKMKESPLFERFQDSDFVAVERLSEYLSVAVNAFLDRVGSDVSSLISFVSNTIVGIILFPIFLFYLLVDVRELNKKVVSFIPAKYMEKGEKIITEIDAGLNAFIKGRVLVCLFLAIISFIGYTFIGLEAPLVLATIVFFTNFIPYLGPLLGALPALVIALISSFSMFVKVLILVIVIQQVEGIFISPQVMSKKLSIHPVVVIVAVILGGHFAGILGVLFAVPFYLIVRVLAVNLLPDKFGEKIKG
ncbi:MAG: AI-2E family transporter [Clostridia bacterium]|nr:AI-2E family transporter [Clostridia bacterium]